jgi:transposase
MPKDQRTFTQEFKQEAVRLVPTSGKSITQVARDLGIADSTLHHWCKLVAEQGEQAFPGSGHQPALEEENRFTQLRRRRYDDTSGIDAGQ